MRKIDKQYGVYHRVGFGESKYDADLTRKIFGMEIETLEQVAGIYHRTFRHDYSGDGYFHRVTCSDKENACDISGNYIPADFPFIAFGDTQYWLGHISLGGFVDTLRFLTDNFDKRAKSTQLLITNGLTDELLNLLAIARLEFHSHVRYGEICRFD